MEHLKKQFEVKVFEAKYFLGIEIEQMKSGSIDLSQRAYIEKVVERFNLRDANPVSTHGKYCGHYCSNG